jgi:hypothetical protein
MTPKVYLANEALLALAPAQAACTTIPSFLRAPRRFCPTIHSSLRSLGKLCRGTVENPAKVGRTPISVNLRKGITRPFTTRLCESFCNLVPISEGLGETVGRKDCHTGFVIHEFNFPPSAASQRPVGIPRGKMHLPPRPFARPKGWRRSCRAAMLVRWPDLFSADVPIP